MTWLVVVAFSSIVGWNVHLIVAEQTATAPTNKSYPAEPMPRFTDNGNQTVRDNLNGLIWTKDANLHRYKHWDAAIAACKDCCVGSYQDWRLPNGKELQSLINFDYYDPALSNTKGKGKWKEGDPFNNVLSNYYWATGAEVGNEVAAWIVNFFHGGASKYDEKINSYYVWCVRGPE